MTTKERITGFLSDLSAATKKWQVYISVDNNRAGKEMGFDLCDWNTDDAIKRDLYCDTKAEYDSSEDVEFIEPLNDTEPINGDDDEDEPDSHIQDEDHLGDSN